MSSFFTSRDFTRSTTEHPSSAGQKPSEPNERKGNKMGKSRMGKDKGGPGKNLRDNGLPPKRPSASARFSMFSLERDWDSQAKNNRRNNTKYRGSREEAEDRGRGIFGWGKR